MTESRTFQITLNEKAYSRLKRIADKIPTSPESMFLFCGLYTLRQIQDHVRHIDFYKKYLLQMEKEIDL